MTRLFAIVVLAMLLAACGAQERQALVPASTGQERPDELFQAGRDAAARGDTVRAEQYLSAAIERGYNRAKALPLLLRVCLSSSRLRAALTHAEPYLRDHPEDDGLRYVVAIIHMGLGKTDEARLDLIELLRHDDQNADAHLLLGILESRSDAVAARDHFRTYLELAPHGEHAGEARSRLAELAVLETERDQLAKRSSDSVRAGDSGVGDRTPSTAPWRQLDRVPGELRESGDEGARP